MGEVYRARDTRLDRTVAVKILTAHWSGSPEGRKRFDVEARAISSLNDPNICTLYDVGHQDGTDYLVMEYLEGETLADRLQRGRLPLDQVLKIGMEIAGALDRAHALGIVHRDLKPGNIMLTKSGAKLMDFGLAKPQASVMSAVSGSGIEVTVSKPLTAEGSIVGTFQYMAPEQLEGGQSDARSDIFGLGAVLYEMATGRRAFEGKSRISVVAAILEKEPEPISTIAPMTPPALEDVVRTCLAKDPQERWQSAHDLKLQLATISKSSATTAGALPANRPSWRRALPWALAAVMTAALAGFALLRKPPSPEPEVARFAIDLGDLSLYIGGGTGGGSRLTVSPDGRKLVLLLARAGSADRQLYLRSIDNFEILPLPGTEGASQPFFSPDSQWVGFSTEGKLKKVPLSGGVPVTLCAAKAAIVGVPATWTDDGTILFIDAGTLYRIPDGGGTPEKVAEPAGNEGRFAWVASLPGNQGVLLVARSNNKFYIDVLSLKTRKRERIIEGGSWPRYLSTGHILYAQYAATGDTSGFTGGLLVVPFNLKKLARTGSPTPVLEGVFTGPAGAGFYDVASTGMLVYSPGQPSGQVRELVWADRNGKTEIPVAAPALTYASLALSPDGTHVAATVVGATVDVHVYDLKRGTLQRLTFEGRNGLPVFTPDGTRVIYSSAPTEGALPNLWWRRADGTGAVERLTTSDSAQLASSVSPDGTLLAFTQGLPGSNADVFIMPLNGDRKPRPFLTNPWEESGGKFSPDGKWIAYASNETGKSEVYVVSYPDAVDKTPISIGGGSSPVWSRDGKQLYYARRDGIMVVDVSLHPVFRAGTPRVFREGLRSAGGFAVAADGRVLFARVPEKAEDGRHEVRVLENFATAVRRRVPAAKP